MVTTPFAVIIVVYGLLLRSSHSSFWRTQRGDEDITISLQYITSKRHGKESVQVSVVFDRPSRTTGTLLTSDTPTTKSPSRPNLSLSSHTNALIHAMLGPDELLLMIEGPSLQAAIATVGMNDSHQTGVMNIPIAGLYHLKVVRTRQRYQAIDEAVVGHPELVYDVLIDVPVKLRATRNKDTTTDTINNDRFAGYWKANDGIGLYLGQPQSNPTAPSQTPQSNPTAPSQSDSPLSLESHKLWQDDRMVSEHFARDLPAMYTRVYLSSSSRIETDGPVKSDRAQSNSPVKSDRAQSNRSLSCATNTNNFHWIWTKHPTTTPSQPSQSNPTAPIQPPQSNLTGGGLWFDEAAAEALLLRVIGGGANTKRNERTVTGSTLLFYGDSHMRTFREAMIGWICNMDDYQKVSDVKYFATTYYRRLDKMEEAAAASASVSAAAAVAAAAITDVDNPVKPDRAAQSIRPVNDEMCVARLLRGTQYLSEPYCDVSRLPHQSSGRFVVLANCGHHPASGSSSSNKNKGQWPLAKYTHAVLDLLATAIGPVKSDRAPSDNPFKRSLSDSPVKSDRASQSNNNEGLGYSPLNFIWMESVPFPLRNDLAVNQSGDWRTLHRLMLFNQVATHLARAHNLRILPSASSLLPLVDKMCDNAHYSAKGALMPMIQAYLAMLQRDQSNFPVKSDRALSSITVKSH